MAAASLLALLDDIATILDDVSVLTKVAAKKTAGVLGDDLALNAQQVSGVRAERELPVVWAVARGSLVNKAILVPAALLLSQFAPWAVMPLLMVGGLYLCFEGFEKIIHPLLHPRDGAARHAALTQALSQPDVNLVDVERDKIKGAIRTDFILSAEIIIIALGTVAGQPLMQRVAVLVAIALAMTVGVYGFVAAIVKMDDAGLALAQRGSRAAQHLGRFLLAFAPKLMRFLSIAGTAAMFLVGGSIVLHGWGWLHHLVAPYVEGRLFVLGMLADAAVGVVGGAAVWALVTLGQRLRGRPASH